jgi:hypothetical protein
MVVAQVVYEVSRWKSEPQKVRCTRVIRTKRGFQWDRFQIRVSRKGEGPWRKQKVLKVKDTIAMRMKRGMKCTRLQIMMLKGPKHFFLLLQIYTTP